MLNFDVRKNEHSTSKVINVHDSYYATPSALCIHGSHAVHVAARRGRGISWYPSHGMRSTLQWGYCSLACDASHVTWSKAIVKGATHGVTTGPATTRGLEIWRPVYGHSAQRRWGYTLQYCSQDNSRASTDRGLLMRYVRGAAAELLTASSNYSAPHNLRL